MKRKVFSFFLFFFFWRGGGGGGGSLIFVNYTKDSWAFVLMLAMKTLIDDYIDTKKYHESVTVY